MNTTHPAKVLRNNSVCGVLIIVVYVPSLVMVRVTCHVPPSAPLTECRRFGCGRSI